MQIGLMEDSAADVDDGGKAHLLPDAGSYVYAAEILGVPHKGESADSKRSSSC